jgi:hypothetical protein
MMLMVLGLRNDWGQNAESAFGVGENAASYHCRLTGFLQADYGAVSLV